MVEVEPNTEQGLSDSKLRDWSCVPGGSAVPFGALVLRAWPWWKDGLALCLISTPVELTARLTAGNLLDKREVPPLPSRA